MAAFDFYFSFYGLLLGLVVAQVANGLGHAIVIRKHSHSGWLTPLLSLFLLVDIASFWIWAWSLRDVVSVSYASIYFGLAVALSYYLAAALLFPAREQDWDNLDQHYWSNKRLVIAGIGLANILVIADSVVREGSPFHGWVAWSLQAAYWTSIAVLMISRWRAVDGICLGALLAVYASAIFT